MISDDLEDNAKGATFKREKIQGVVAKLLKVVLIKLFVVVITIAFAKGFGSSVTALQQKRQQLSYVY